MPYSSRELLALLLAAGWEEVAQEGSHKQFKHPDRPGRVTLPHPKKDIPEGTAHSIFRQAGLEWKKRKR